MRRYLKMGIIYKSNVAATGQTLDATKYAVSTSQDVYSEYEARVINDGGIIVDSAKCLEAIDKAIKGRYFTDSTVAVSPMWGIKKSGVNLIKMYSLRGEDYDCTTFGTVLIDTTRALHAVDTQLNAYLKTPDFAYAKSALSGCVISSVVNKPSSGAAPISTYLANAPTVSVSMNLLSSSNVLTARVYNKAAQLTTTQNNGSASAISSATTYIDNSTVATFGLINNGIHISAQIASGVLYDMSVDKTSTLHQNNLGSDLFELWLLNTSNLDKAKNLSFDQGARYSALV